MLIKKPSLEDALLKIISNGRGSVYEFMILAHDHGVELKKINRILKKHIKNNKITILGNKFVMLYHLK